MLKASNREWGWVVGPALTPTPSDSTPGTPYATGWFFSVCPKGLETIGVSLPTGVAFPHYKMVPGTRLPNRAMGPRATEAEPKAVLLC